MLPLSVRPPSFISDELRPRGTELLQVLVSRHEAVLRPALPMNSRKTAISAISNSDPHPLKQAMEMTEYGEHGKP